MPKPPVDLLELDSLIQIVADLRGPNGCPWDKEQNHKTLVPYAVEEIHELAEALESGDDHLIQEELGDVLFQVVLHAQLAAERKAFDLKQVIQCISQKLIRRHPHVFSDVQVDGIDQVFENWELIKAKEKAEKKQKTSTLNVPAGLPALQRSAKIGFRTQKLKFDWDNSDQVFEKVNEEFTELKEALTEKNKKAIEHELGDMIFSLAQLARHLDVDPEQCARSANRRFENRFEFMNKLIYDAGKKLETMSLSEKEEFWQKAKIALKDSE